MHLVGALLFALGVAADGAIAVRASTSGAGLAVMAQRAPVSAVLEEIGRRSGVRVIYDGGAPTTLMTCDFVAASPGEAFQRALEGSGLNYALHEGKGGAPGILLVSMPAGSAVTTRSALPTATTVAGSLDEEARPLARPPRGGAIPPRFTRDDQEEPSNEEENGALASENDSPPSESVGPPPSDKVRSPSPEPAVIQPLQMPSAPAPSPARQGRGQDRRRGSPNQRN